MSLYDHTITILTELAYYDCNQIHASHFLDDHASLNLNS